MDYRKFNQNALDAYIQWVKKEHGVDLVMEDPPEIPNFADMLTGNVDAIVKNNNGTTWPVMVKSVWQSKFGNPKSIEEIANSRSNFYLEHGEKGKWNVKKLTPVYYACQNIMIKYGYNNMDLICYSELSNSLLVVAVKLELETYFANFEALKDYVQAGPEFFFKKP